MALRRSAGQVSTPTRGGAIPEANRTVRPRAVPDAVTTPFQTPIDIDVLANDVAGTSALAPGDIRIIKAPQVGTVEIVSGEIRYTPATGYIGADRFEYAVRDARGVLSRPAEVIVTVAAPTPPVTELYDNDYQHRFRIRIPASAVVGPDNLNDFILLIDHQDPDLRTVANGGSVESPDGHDIRFETEGGNHIPHWLAWYDGAAGRVVAAILTDIPSGQGVTALMYAGNSDVVVPEQDPPSVFSGYALALNTRTGEDLTGQDRDLTPTGITTGTIPPSFALYNGTTAELQGPVWSGIEGKSARTVRMLFRATPTGATQNRGVFKVGGRNANALGHAILCDCRGATQDPANNHVSSFLANQGRSFSRTAAGTHEPILTMRHDRITLPGAPRTMLNGIQMEPQAPSVAPGTTTATVSGFTFVGVGLNTTTVPADGNFEGEIAFVSVQDTDASDNRCATEARNWTKPRLFHGIGSRDTAGDATESPVAVPQRVTVERGSSVLVNVRSGALDPVGAGLTVSAAGAATRGTTEIENGGVRYTSDGTGAGTEIDEFTFTLSDTFKTSTSIVQVTIVPPTVEPPPPLIANPDSATVTAGQSVDIDVIGNDLGEGIEILSFTQGATGTVTDQTGGVLRFAADAGGARADSFTYTIEDDFGQTATATVSVSVTPAPPAIQAVNDSATVTQGGTTDVNVLANDIGTGLAVQSFSQPAVGTVTNQGGGVLRIAAANNAAVGAYTFPYTAVDPALQTSSAIVSFNILSASAEFPAPAGPSPQTRTVNNRAELVTALAASQPGNHIILNNGDYTGADLTLNRSGTAALPIVIRAANRVRATDATVTTVGARILFRIVLACSHVMLYGLNIDGRQFPNRNFAGTLVQGSRDVAMQNITIRRCFFHGERGGCLLFRGSTINGILVDGCAFTHRRWTDDYPVNISARDLNIALGLDPDDNRTGFVPEKGRRGVNFGNEATNITVRRCYFFDFGQGLVKYSFTDQHIFFSGEGSASGVYPTQNVLFERNLILRCPLQAHGNPLFEYKANLGITRSNTFDQTSGSITQRQGFGAIFVSNYIRQHGTGIRFFDRNHSVIGNVLDGGTGVLEILAGSVPHDVTPTSAKNNKYPATADVLLAGNVRVAGAQPLYRVGHQFRADNETFPSLRTRIEGYQASHGNIVYVLHSGTQGPFAATASTWTPAVRLLPADVGLDGPLT